MVRLFLIHDLGTDGMARSAEIERLAVMWLKSTVSTSRDTQITNSGLHMNYKRGLRALFT